MVIIELMSSFWSSLFMVNEPPPEPLRAAPGD